MTGKALFGLLTAALLLITSPAQAGAHKEIVPPPKIEIDPVIEADVKAVIHDTAERWNSQDFATLLELWDPDEAYPTYLAEEQAQWFIGWDRIRSYLDPARPNPAIEAIRRRDVEHSASN